MLILSHSLRQSASQIAMCRIVVFFLGRKGQHHDVEVFTVQRITVICRSLHFFKIAQQFLSTPGKINRYNTFKSPTPVISAPPPENGIPATIELNQVNLTQEGAISN